MGLTCLVYPGLCQKPFDILNKCNFKYVRCHRGATVSFFPTQVVTNYIAGTSNQASPGFRILLETVIGQVYQLKTTATLTLGDKAFVYVETPDGQRLVPRTNLFVTGGGSTSYVIEFTATEQLTFVGILFQNFDVSYSLTTTEFLVSCLDPIDCNQVIDCLCQIEHCPDTYTYEICVDFLQVHLDLLNSPASFPVGTVLSIQGYRIAEGSVDIGATGLPALIGIVPITFNQMRSAFEALTWQTIGLGLIGEFRATLKDQVLIISHVLVDNDLNIGPPFSINLPTNCTQLDECATNNPANRLLIKKPDNSLCWANICPPLIDTCLTKCSLEDHVGILPDENLSSNASLSVGPRGSGFLCAQKPLPGSTGGGDCRGSYAVDWQMFRDTSDDVAGADFSVIGGGASNHIQDGEVALHQFGTTGAEGSVIAGGQSNEIHISVFDEGDFPFFSGISGPTGTDLSYSTISGGFSNQIKVEAEDQSSFFSGQATIAGGAYNFIHTRSLPAISGIIFADKSLFSLNNSSTIGGGGGNLIETQGNGMRTDFSVIGGGGGTGATGTGNIIRAVGDVSNLNHYSVISGGERNRIEALGSYNNVSHSVVGGGGRNLIQAIGSGTNYFERCRSSFSVIDGGLDNRIAADGLNSKSQYSVIGGGYGNKIVAKNVAANASSAVITGGFGNKIYAYSSVSHSAIGGGQDNKIYSLGFADCNHSVIAGGRDNIVAGAYSTVSGGQNNTAFGAHSWAGGKGATTSHSGSFVWGGSVGAGSTQKDSVTFAGVFGATTGKADAIPVVVDSTGMLGTTVSSIRYKENIKSLLTELPDKLVQLVNLNPVQFNYKTDLSKTPTFGLIAEEVLEQFPELVVYKDNQIETIKYHQLVPLLLADLKRHRAETDLIKTEFETYKKTAEASFKVFQEYIATNQTLADNAISTKPIIGVGASPAPVNRGCSVFYLHYDIGKTSPHINWCDPTKWANLNDSPPNGLTDAVKLDTPNYSPFNGDLVIMNVFQASNPDVVNSQFAQSCIFKYENDMWVTKRVFENTTK